MDPPTPAPRRRLLLRRRVLLPVVALVVAGTVFATGHHDSKVALSASCGPAAPTPTPAPTTPVAVSPTSLDLSIPKAPTTPIGASLGAAAATPATTPATTPVATTTPGATTPEREYCKPGQTTPVLKTTPAPPGTDLTGPTADDLSGTALASGSIKGRKSLIFDAADAGSGVWQVEVTLGSTKVVPRFTVDTNHGRCDTIGQAAPTVEIPKDEDTAPTSTTPLYATTPATTPASTTPVKSGCKTKVHAKLPVDTKQVANGPQFLTATLWDAAGNPTVVVNREVTVANDAPKPAKVKTYTIKSVPNTEDQLLDAPTEDSSQLEAGSNGQAASTTKQSQADNAAPSAALLSAAAKTPPTVSADTITGRFEAAMNALGAAQVPYCWGGGHGTSPAVPSGGSYCWIGNPAQRVSAPNVVGLDCSSSVSWVLQQVGYPIPTLVSGQFAQLGEPGPGKVLTIWANSTHVYMQIEIRGHSYYWGTSEENFEHGPNWHSPRSGAGFVARHLPGL
ncbi:MAG: hypothetical protein AAGC46_08710 [Solirubrobacteraceae bacterium]|nr:hypothetical protein [Patulibacter sp.]